MRTHEPTVTRDIKAHFERISQLFRSGLPVRTGTVGPQLYAPPETLRLARAYGDGWRRASVPPTGGTACPCVRGRLGRGGAAHARHVGLPVRTGTVGERARAPQRRARLARAYGDGWVRLKGAWAVVEACPCVWGRLARASVCPRCVLRLARAYGDGWAAHALRLAAELGLPVRMGTVGSGSTARSRATRLARAYGDGWTLRESA